MLIDSAHYAAELMVASQALAAADRNLQIVRAALTDIVCGRSALLVPSGPRESMPRVTHTQHSSRRPRLYASGEMARQVLAIMGHVDELSVTDLLRALQVEKPGTQMASLRPCMTHLVQDGQMVRVRKGVYALPMRLRVVADGEA